MDTIEWEVRLPEKTSVPADRTDRAEVGGDGLREK